MQKYLPLVARTLVAAIFVRSGITKILGFAGTRGYMAANGIPQTMTLPLLILTIIVEIIGGLCVFLGFKARWGALALFLFLIPATLIFHTNFADQIQTIQFFKNLAIMGGLLMVCAYGSGSLSLERDRYAPEKDSWRRITR
jgi:putative oxidoreductase